MAWENFEHQVPRGRFELRKEKVLTGVILVTVQSTSLLITSFPFIWLFNLYTSLKNLLFNKKNSDCGILKPRDV